jgi:hypothetical protein
MENMVYYTKIIHYCYAAIAASNTKRSKDNALREEKTKGN